MLTRTKLVVDVGELLKSPGTPEHLAFSEAVGGLETDLVRVDESDELSFDLTFEVVEDGVLVRGPVRGKSHVTCRRCLGKISSGFEIQATEVYRPSRDVWEEGYVVVNETVDLDPLVRDTVLINLPQFPLCREDCRGLCPVCGQDLNDSECGCDRERTDIRWQALRDLLKDA